MAAATATTMTFTVAAPASVSPASSAGPDSLSRLSSANAFGGPRVARFSRRQRAISSRAIGARAALHQDSKTPRREMLAGIAAVGAALGFGGKALADPIADAQKKFEGAIAKVQGAAPDLPDAGGAVKDAQKGADSVKGNIKGSIDNVFGKGKPPPFKFPGVGTIDSVGKVADDAQQKIGAVGSVADTAGSASDAKDFVQGKAASTSGVGKDVTDKAQSAASKVQEKGSDVVSSGKSLLGDVKSGAPSLPDLFPKGN